MHMQMPEEREGLRYPGAGVAGDCVLPNVGAGLISGTHMGQLAISARAASAPFGNNIIYF